MTKPVYKIEVYDSVPDLIHTITSGALMVRAKETLTGNVGTFSFILPGLEGKLYPYSDIASNDKVKIWFGYDTIAGDPFSVGKVYQPEGVLSEEGGYTRTFRGRNLGEILQRRLKAMKTWEAVAASVIATEVADDLGLGKDIVEDLTEVDMTIDIDRHETYFNLLRRLSDYWFDAGTQVKKDFFVNVADALVWKARPLRSGASVETFTVGRNIDAYSVLRGIESVQNKIHVYGAKELADPIDKDELTEDLTLVGNTLETTDAVWTVLGGGSTISKDADEDVGDWAVKTAGGAATGLILTFDGGHEKNANHYPMLVFRCKADDPLIFVYLEDTGGEVVYAHVDLPELEYYLFHIPVGRKNTDHWTLQTAGPFDWTDISIVEFGGDAAAGRDLWIDGLFFNNRNFYGMAENAASQASYELREMSTTDLALRSTAECVTRAESILYQLKDEPIRVDLQVPGNMNVLIGDRVPITIPAEGLSAVDFDVLTVEHAIIGDKFKTFPTMINSANVRTVPPSTRDELLVREFNRMKQIAKGILNIK